MILLTDTVDNVIGVSGMRFMNFLLLLGVVAVVGCGSEGGGTVDASSESNAFTEQIKASLQSISESGEIDAEMGLGELRTVAEDLKASDSAKGETILKELDALEALSSPDERKAKAKEIISTL